MGRHSLGVSCCGILTSLFGITEMNERIKELEKQAWEFVDKTWNWANANNPSQATLFKEKFAELIVRECVKVAMKAVSDDEPKEAWYLIEEHFGVEE
jgi:hypothetical protein